MVAVGISANMSISPETLYMQKMIEADRVIWEYNILASASRWILLAGYLILPGSFTNLQNSQGASHEIGQTHVGKAILIQIQNPPLISLGCLFFCVGSCGMGALYWKNQDNYIWLVNRLFM